MSETGHAALIARLRTTAAIGRRPAATTALIREAADALSAADEQIAALRAELALAQTPLTEDWRSFKCPKCGNADLTLCPTHKARLLKCKPCKMWVAEHVGGWQLVPALRPTPAGSQEPRECVGLNGPDCPICNPTSGA